MKKVLCVLIFSALINYANAQQKFYIMYGDTLNLLDSQNKKQGLWQDTTFGNVSKGYYVDSKKDGMWITYNSKNVITKMESYKNGLKHGTFAFLDDYGYYKSEATYKNDNLNGPQRNFAAGGRILKEEYYLNGSMHGLKKVYYEQNNMILEESYYKYGLRDSIAKYYNSNGNLIAIYPYKMGNFEGVVKTFYSSGNLQSEETYSQNISNGAYKEYFDDSLKKVKLSGQNINGIKEGKWIEYDIDGKVIKTTTYKNGEEKK